MAIFKQIALKKNFLGRFKKQQTDSDLALLQLCEYVVCPCEYHDALLLVGHESELGYCPQVNHFLQHLF